jgi:glutathione S-transferase/nicotinamidase-related amidase
MMAALVVIDLQNDFVSAEGALKDKHIRREGILASLNEICDEPSAFNGGIVIVRSEYLDKEIYEANVPVRDEGFRAHGEFNNHLTSAHIGKRQFCAPDSHGSDYPNDVRAFVEKFATKEVTKHWYSAFTATGLDQYLKYRGVDEVYFAGVTANNCVLASLTDAFFLGYKVRIIEDCVGATSPSLLKETLRKVNTFYGDVVSMEDLRKEGFKSQGSKGGTKYNGKRTLYWVNGSIPSWRVMLCLAQKGIPYHRKRLRVMSTPKETRLPEFLAINPRGKTPTLIDEDGTVIMESMAILEYLETFYPDPKLVPDPRTEKAQWKLVMQRFHESENLHNVFEDIELLYEPGWKEDPQRSIILYTYQRTVKELKVWERYLIDAPFVAGSIFSLADCALYPILAYLIHRGFDLTKEKLPRLLGYHQRVDAMPCAVDALPFGYEKVAKTNLGAKIYGMIEEDGGSDATAT